MVFPNHLPSSKTRIVIVAILAAFFILGGYYLYHLKGSNTSQGNHTSSHAHISLESRVSNALPTSQTSQNSANLSQPLSLPAVSGLSSYVSQTNKLGFYFTSKMNNGGVNTNITTREQGNKIFIYPANSPDTYDYIQTLSKASGDTIQEAIMKNVLYGYSPANCILSVQTNGTETYAEIKYSPDNISQYGPWPLDPSKCPEQYTSNEAHRYFMVDSTHPDKLIFISDSIAIPAGNKSWADTLTLF